MHVTTRWTVGAVFAVGLAVTAAADSGKKFVITDDCRPNADWGTGGCLRESGQVTRAEFGAANARGYPGHPAWRIEPSYVDEQNQRDIRVENTGGRDHTFTEVTQFGGGFVPPLNTAQSTPASQCATVNPNGTLSPAPEALATLLRPGDELRIEGLAPGTHLFQCCIHPWMRTTVKIAASSGHQH
jgi:hypothetical protein